MNLSITFLLQVVASAQRNLDLFAVGMVLHTVIPASPDVQEPLSTAQDVVLADQLHLQHHLHPQVCVGECKMLFTLNVSHD